MGKRGGEEERERERDRDRDYKMMQVWKLGVGEKGCVNPPSYYSRIVKEMMNC